MYMGLVQELHLENFYVRETWGSEDVPSKSCSVFNSYALTAFSILGKVERVFASDTMPSGLELTGGGPFLRGKVRNILDLVLLLWDCIWYHTNLEHLSPMEPGSPIACRDLQGSHRL